MEAKHNPPMSPLKLSELNRFIQQVLSLEFSDTYWVLAEISDCREAANGHCYLELVEKDQECSGAFTAKARANIWRNVWQPLKSYFMKETGRPFSAGIRILAEVSVQFHEVYGYSLTIHNVDATYTLGEQQLKRQRILQQLEEDGVLSLNRELELPTPLQRIAIISAENAAGYEDFVNQLEQSGFKFQSHLFPANMQGVLVAESVITALDAIALEQEKWDVVVIIRGGGATSDLDGFENYDLAANIAQFPLPIFTGIGHERDDTVIDFIAHTRCKTPTAVAAFLIERMQNVHAIIDNIEERLHRATTDYLQMHQLRYERLSQRYSTAAISFVNHQQQVHHRLAQRITTGLHEQLNFQSQLLQRVVSRLHTNTHLLIERKEHQLSLFAQTLRWADPQRTLAMGYSITYTSDGKLLSAASALRQGTRLRTVVADGEVWSTINEVS